MQKTYNRGKHDGFQVSKDISIHGHIHDPDCWYLTIRKLNINGRLLCSKEVSESYMICTIKEVLSEEKNKINQIASQL